MRLERIDDPADPRADDYRGVRDPEWLKRRGLFIAEGRQILEVLLARGDIRVRSLLLTRPALEALGPALAKRADPAPAVLLAPAALLQSVGGYAFHQGALGAAAVPALPDPARLGSGAPSPRRLLLLEDVTNPDNVGSAFRSCQAFGGSGVLLSPRCAHPLYRKALRTSMGAALQLPFAFAVDWRTALEDLRGAGYVRVGLSPDARGTPLSQVAGQLRGEPRVALLLGHERDGLRAATLEQCELRVRIPMASGVDSLNVATAGAIAMHALAGL